MIAALNQPYHFSGHEHHSSPSIGITLFSAQDETVDSLLKQSDIAMYQAKAAGRNTLRFFNADMQAAVTQRALMEEDLHKGILERQFTLYYQSQVEQSGRILGCEALVRWNHPQLNFVTPADFIPLAEETGLIIPLGQWVLTAACQQLAAWANSPVFSHVTIAVNVSVSQFKQDNFIDQVLMALRQSGANPNRLKLELTESLIASDLDDIIRKMKALKQIGVSFSLDDFGTGFSSLNYLKKLPFDQLKIDQSFVKNILTDQNDAAIATIIIKLADSLGLQVIAEGVETQAQLDFLATSGCPYYQGYLFNRPCPVEEFEQLFESMS
ncbi:putative bifunctional diguanylate cyclase/phosphodiesterase [Methylocucumis oryzae]|uniref:putative bifunctional diguanylate cyclase/phosphodiesterase n=1 Tax=Methylocucumis oryzae TaxID=1632867 RepID=UPI0006978252|nr:GGDEF domain-containing phosphodiesterase [Methylocucumis oryzae]